MAKFCPLFSGSSGNSFYLESGHSSLLIDIGVSCRAVTNAMKDLGAFPQDLDGILITHEHSDHIKGLPVFLKKAQVPVYGSQPVLDYIENTMPLPAGTTLIPVDMDGFSVGDIEVKPFRTPHDSVGSLGYQLRTPDHQQIGLATDLGHYTDEVHEGLSGSDLVVLESNYDDGMILVSSYPYVLKRRIMSGDGHLSNLECAAALIQLAEQGTRKFILSHLSLNNNMRELAEQASCLTLGEAGLTCGKDYSLQIANRTEISAPTIL